MLSFERARSWIGSTLVLASCASTGAAPVAPPHYPALPPPAAVSASFAPEASLQAVETSCGEAELAENGLDDDCDGVIDSAPAEPKATAMGLTIAAAQRAEITDEVRLDLTDEAGGTVPNLAMRRALSRSPAVTLSRLDLSGLPRGRYRLTASRQGPQPEPAELSLAVSLTTSGVAHTYLVRLGAGETRTLGAIEVR